MNMRNKTAQQCMRSSFVLLLTLTGHDRVFIRYRISLYQYMYFIISIILYNVAKVIVTQLKIPRKSQKINVRARNADFPLCRSKEYFSYGNKITMFQAIIIIVTVIITANLT